jgi:hypothetical protein
VSAAKHAAARSRLPKTGVFAPPKKRLTLRALGGRRVVFESYGRSLPIYVAIAGASDVPVGAWFTPAELRRFAETARRILK